MVDVHTAAMTAKMVESSPSLLVNPLATPEQLETSSSQLDGVPTDLENSVRYASCQTIQAAGILLRSPQDIIAQSIITFTRFWIGPDGGSLKIYNAHVGSTQAHEYRHEII